MSKELSYKNATFKDIKKTKFNIQLEYKNQIPYSTGNMKTNSNIRVKLNHFCKLKHNLLFKDCLS